MSFLSPWFLLGALAVAGPVLFHLIRHTTRERRIFSSVMFLPSARPRLTRRSRLQHLVLLVLRCLALGLLALGFARPFLRQAGPAAAAGAGPRRLVLLINASASMRRTGLWAEARARAARILREAGPGDEAAVFLYSGRVRPLLGFEEWRAAAPGARVALALARLDAAAPGWEDDRLGDALIRAGEVLVESDAERRPDGPRQIYLISDLKAGSRLDSLEAYDWPKSVELRVEALRAQRPTNAGLQLVAEAPEEAPAATAGRRVRVRNAANSTREQFRVGWTGPGGAALAPPVDVYVPPGQSRVVTVPPLARSADMRQLSLRGDDEDFDNTVFVAAAETRRWNVVYLGAEAAGDPTAPRYFLQRALPDNPRLVARLVAFAPGAAVPAPALAEAKLVVVTRALPDGLAEELRAQLLAGRTVLVAPPDARAAPTLARLLARDSVPLEDVQPADYAMFGDIDFQHPVFAPFADPHFSDFTKIHIWKYRRLRPGEIPGARIVARLDGGDPALVEVAVGSGRLLLLLTGWNPGDSQLAVSSKFVPLIQSILELAGGALDESGQYTVGDPLPLGSTKGATILRPDGTTATVPPGTGAYRGAASPGSYEIESGGRRWRVAVNLAATESRTEPLPADELERYGAPGERPPPDAVRAVRREAVLRAEEEESRQKLWRWILGATLAVLLAESALAGWTMRRGETTVEPEKAAV